MQRLPFKKRAITAQERRDLAARLGCKHGERVEVKCAYCNFIGAVEWVTQPRGNGWVMFDRLEMDHSHPEVQGGSGADNLVVACRRCNRSKGPRTVDQWRGK